MSGIFFKTPLTDEELTEFTQLFNSLDIRHKSTVNFVQVQALLSKTGLPSETIISIWNLVDTHHTQQLDFKQFAALLRAIGKKQHYPLVPIDTNLFEVPSPKIILSKEANTTITSTPALSPDIITHHHHQSTSSTTKNMNNDNIISDPAQSVEMPPLTPNDLSKFSQLFDRACKGPDNVLSGNDAKQIFVKAKLSNKVLGAIWYLCDNGTKGYLTKEEFIMAMHLIDLRLSKHGSMDPLPRKLSEEVWDSVNLGSIKTAPPKPPTSSQAMAAPQQNVNRNSVISSGNSAPKPPPHRASTLNNDVFAAFNGSPDDWTVSPQLKGQLEKMFDTLNTSNSEILTPDILVPVLTKSSLSKEDLADVWELADMDKKSALTKNEFVIAMFLIKKVKARTTLPQEIPPQLLDSLQRQPSQFDNQSIRSRTSTNTNPQPSQIQTPQTNKSIGQFQTPEMPSPKINSSHVPPGAPIQEAIRKQSVNQFPSTNQKEILETQANIKNLENKMTSAESELSESYKLEVNKGQELEPLKAKEAELTEKLGVITLGIEESTTKTTELEAQIEETNKNISSLEQELTTAEGNYHASEARLDELHATLQESSTKHEQMKSEIVNLQSMTASVNSQLALKQDEVRDVMISVDGTTKELDSNRITADNIQKEIDALDTRINLYLNKKKELDNYENVVKDQHEKLEKKYKELEKHSEKIKHFEQLLKEKESAYKTKLNDLDSNDRLTLKNEVANANNQDDSAILSEKIDHINLNLENNVSSLGANDATTEKIPDVPAEQVIENPLPIEKQESTETDNDPDEFQDTVEEIIPTPTEVEDIVNTPVADTKSSDYVEVPAEVSEEPFEQIESNDANEDDVTI
ncbi:similar to Saccharomyces cerevisiae YBL047C EDE1 Key endocytic protein involved in a network of interactions with other endocytic proteins [Maudiozyma saulgeensis]|uniref:Similar to Saccharomyces cerevisiae YBL047C EDE1 Key endocytic protein involved in a network of interactions with other endocytic proteins n=1 Tax=Maudiozyma saulgeensis TaxID=1789683 RepID=A0A1X7R6G8_9SACH|nr:similar to Saccharomyces cerevisiae YBL047C EDE1 Key endocytic protein involved in a network of interactions with other endocytic proteins [Kazachstania saulgeensis]